MDQVTFEKYVNDRDMLARLLGYDAKSMRNQVWYRTFQWGGDFARHGFKRKMLRCIVF